MSKHASHIKPHIASTSYDRQPNSHPTIDLNIRQLCCTDQSLTLRWSQWQERVGSSPFSPSPRRAALRLMAAVRNETGNMGFDALGIR
jgi:hypothetical protein